MELHRPGKDVDDPALVLVGLLDFYREVVIAKLDGCLKPLVVPGAA